ncbi:ethylene-responsive transcription factor-like protein At4g13040 isoform X4 [Musa acuminata AAA Group]|uniref:ethylene-responsive transcription factor-like protein At4g13040 isoform X4 n=1 Tax=Musa acuminata AAA Group TaxID=214697 RepID=UPI0031D33E19
MVSIRRRRYLGLCSGKSSFPVVVPQPIDNGNSVENPNQHVKPVSVNKSETYSGSSNVSGLTTPKEALNHHCPEIKRSKRHRRKHYEDQEPRKMTGVYFKNMKWQAAIKVDKKQIHLGTVESQEEAARLYDRAAFMCGREPNFELTEEEKQELKQYNWDDFLAMTRSAINNKKNQRKIGAGRRKKLESQLPNNNRKQEGGTPVSSISEDDEDVDVETSAS